VFEKDFTNLLKALRGQGPLFCTVRCELVTICVVVILHVRGFPARAKTTRNRLQYNLIRGVTGARHSEMRADSARFGNLWNRNARC
jgi:hypothetical protein